MASLGRSTLFDSFVFGATLVRISVNVHAFRLYLVHLVAGASSARFHRLLINVSRRIMDQTAIVLVD